MTPDATASKEAWFLVRMLCDNRNQTRGRSPVNLLEEEHEIFPEDLGLLALRVG